jgi:lipid-A-disaccharide synthase
LLAPFAAAVNQVGELVGSLDVVLPTVGHLRDDVVAATQSWSVRPKVIVENEEKRAAFRVARAALAASGTVTLELALAGVPMVTAYRLAAVEAAFVRRLIRVPSVILTNLVLGENVVPEFLQEACTPDRLAAALAPLLADTPARRSQLDAFARLDAIMEIGTAAPSVKAAQIVAAIACRAGPTFEPFQTFRA